MSSPVSLSSHLSHAVLVACEPTELANAVAGWWRRRGVAPELARTANIQESRRWLLPLTSFPVRYLVRRYGHWSALISNAPGMESLSVPLAMALKRTSYELMWSPDERLLRVSSERGLQVRFVHVYRDAGWVCDESGDAVAEEGPTWLLARKKAERLTPAHVLEFLRRLANGVETEPWKLACEDVIGVELNLSPKSAPNRTLVHIDDVDAPCETTTPGTSLEQFIAPAEFLRLEGELAAGGRSDVAAVFEALAAVRGVEEVRVELHAWEEIEGAPFAAAVWVRGGTERGIRAFLGDLQPDDVTVVAGPAVPAGLRAGRWLRLWWD